MAHQGNTYLGYNLILLVQPPASDGEDGPLDDDITPRAILAHVHLHLFCRFCKDNNDIPAALLSIVHKRVSIGTIRRDALDRVHVNRASPHIYVLIDLGENVPGRSDGLCDFTSLQEYLRRQDPSVHVERFLIHRPDKQVAETCEKAIAGPLVTDPQSLYDGNLYHLASRVCSALTEYRAAWTMPQKEDEHFKGQGDLRFLDIQTFDPDAPVAAPPRLHDSTVVKKLMDIRDAVDFVCGCLDGAMHYFPPIPDSLHHLFAGRDTADSVWARYKFPFGVWFHGVSRVCYDLTPSLFRHDPPKQMHPGCSKRHGEQIVTFDECSMVHHFREYLPTLKREYGAMFDWLSLMQHHQAPTRLLDWTENILFALYFAVRDRRADCDGAVWVLNAGRLNEITRVSSTRRYVCFPSSTDVLLRTAMAISHNWGELRRSLLKLGVLGEVMDALSREDKHMLEWLMTNPPVAEMKQRETAVRLGMGTEMRSLTLREKLALAVAVYPSRVNERLADQLGTFTLHGGKTYDPQLIHNFAKGRFDRSLSMCSLNNAVVRGRINGKQFLDVLVIPSGAKRKLREQLKRLGVHAAAVFPDLDFQSEYMKREWMIPKDAGQSAEGDFV